MGHPDEGTRQLLGILTAMAGDAEVIDDIVATARADVPELARLPAADTRRRVSALFAEGIGLFSDPDDDDRDFSAARALGSDRAAQHIPLSAALSALHAGHNRLTGLVALRARAAGVSDGVLLKALMTFNEWMASLERNVLSGYQSTEWELARSIMDLRLHVLGRLLHDSPPVPEEILHAGLDPTQPYHLLLADDPGQRTLVRACSEAGGFFGAIGSGAAGLAPRLPAPDGSALVVASPPILLHEMSRYHRPCLDALSAARMLGLHGLQLVVSIAGPAALAAQPLLAGLVRDDFLSRLDPTTGFHRDLARTALAYLDNGRRLDQTAALLHVHPNTVRYRIDRLEALTRIPLDPAADNTVLHTLHWWWSLTTWLNDAWLCPEPE
ncbi:MAG: helix-turn-helix domain-containing protein [Streptosporangiaceae bacterium]